MRKEVLIRALLLACVIFACVSELYAKRPPAKKRPMQSKGKIKTRQNIVKCCGNSRCTEGKGRKNISNPSGAKQKIQESSKSAPDSTGITVKGKTPSTDQLRNLKNKIQSGGKIGPDAEDSTSQDDMGNGDASNSADQANGVQATLNAPSKQGPEGGADGQAALPGGDPKLGSSGSGEGAGQAGYMPGAPSVPGISGAPGSLGAPEVPLAPGDPGAGLGLLGAIGASQNSKASNGSGGQQNSPGGALISNGSAPSADGAQPAASTGPNAQPNSNATTGTNNTSGSSAQGTNPSSPENNANATVSQNGTSGTNASQQNPNPSGSSSGTDDTGTAGSANNTENAAGGPAGGNGTLSAVVDDDEEDTGTVDEVEQETDVASDYKYQEEEADYEGLDANGQPKTTRPPVICDSFNMAALDIKNREDKYLNDRLNAMEKNVTLPTTPKPVFRGTVIPFCGREYFIGTERKSVKDASKVCMDRGQALLSIESLAEFKCLTDIFKILLKYGGRFWTSVSLEGPDLKEYKQCASDVTHEVLSDFMKNDSYWFARNATKPKSQRCLAYKMNGSVYDNTTGFYHEMCKASLIYMCEPRCQNSGCPTRCATNNSLFEAGGKLKKPETHGVWLQKCGKTYLFGNALVTWEENWQKCCSLGMDPVYFESVMEQQCVVNFTYTNWTLNQNYWTGGTAMGCGGHWRWCGTTDYKLKSGLLWEKGQPDNNKGNETCLHMNIYDKLGVRLTDRNCTNKYIYACQGNPNIGKPCVNNMPACPINKCSKDKALFNYYTGELTNFKSYGTWIQACKRTYMFSREKLSWEAAYYRCCAIGMNLVSVGNWWKHRCLIKGIKSENKTMGTYWTSGTDFNCTDKHYWCGDKTPFKNAEVYWADGQPRSIDGDCVKITGTTNSNTSFYANARCSTLLNFICEARQQGTEGQSIFDECAAMTEADLDSIEDLGFEVYNSTMAERSSLSTKCFIKCVADKRKVTGSTGGLDPVATIRMLELTTKGNPEQMQSGFGAFENCKPSADMDECNTASDIFACTVVKANDVIDKMVGTVRNDTKVYIPPVPCKKLPRECPTTTCVLSTTLKNEVTSTNKTSVGKLWKLPSGKILFVSNTGQYNSTYAFQYCCNLGMNLYRPLSYEELQAVTEMLKLTSWGYAMSAAIGFTRDYNGTHEVWCDNNGLVIRPLVLPSAIYPGYSCDKTILMAHLYRGYQSFLRIRETIHKFNLFICQYN